MACIMGNEDNLANFVLELVIEQNLAENGFKSVIGYINGCF
jgi:hypothetical protein